MTQVQPGADVANGAQPRSRTQSVAAGGAEGRLLRNGGFRRLWLGQTVSVFGSQVTVLALPFTAVVLLHASTLQVGLLTTAEYAPFLAIGLPTGVWVDRVRRRPIMIAADALRALVLASVPLAYVLGLLSLAQLYVVAVAQGVGTVFFDVAYMSYLPGLVGRQHLVESNAKLQVSQSVAEVSGPTVSGLLISLLSAPVAFVADAASFVVSVCSLLSIRQPEAAPTSIGAPNLRAEIAEGLRFVMAQPVLRMIAGATATGNLFGAAFSAISVVFLVRQVGLGAATIGVITSAAAVGGVVGCVQRHLATTLARARPGHLDVPHFHCPLRRAHPVDVAGTGLGVLRRGPVHDQLWHRRLQHQPGVVPSTPLPAPPSWPHERHHALPRLGHAASRRPPRRGARVLVGYPQRHLGSRIGRGPHAHLAPRLTAHIGAGPGHIGAGPAHIGAGTGHIQAGPGPADSTDGGLVHE